MRLRVLSTALGAGAVVPDCRLQTGIQRPRDIRDKAVADMPRLARRYAEQIRGVVEDAPVRLARIDIRRRHDGIEVLVEAEVGETQALDIPATVRDHGQPVLRTQRLQQLDSAVQNLDRLDTMVQVSLDHPGSQRDIVATCLKRLPPQLLPDRHEVARWPPCS